MNGNKLKKLIIYHSSVAKVGGVETVVYNLIKRLKDKFDITFVYKYADYEQLKKINELVQCIRFMNQQFKCDVLISMTSWGASITQNVKADKIIQIIHAELGYYKENNFFTLKPDIFVDQYVTVSKTVQDSLFKLNGIESTLIYNLLDTDTPQFPKIKNGKLTLITTSRLSAEKGIKRCIQLAKKINTDYVWRIYGSAHDPSYEVRLKELSKGTNIEWMGFKSPIYKEVAESDYLVQLSDTEGFCTSINESLYQLTPVICTPFTSVFEQIEDGKNGYIIDFDIENVDLDKIINKIPKIKAFKEKSSVNDWIDLINSENSRLNKEIRVVSTKRYFDTAIGKELRNNTEFTTTIERARKLINNNVAKVK